MVFAALVMVRAEILWFFSHVGVMVGKAKGTRVMPIEMVLNFSTPARHNSSLFSHFCACLILKLELFDR